MSHFLGDQKAWFGLYYPSAVLSMDNLPGAHAQMHISRPMCYEYNKDKAGMLPDYDVAALIHLCTLRPLHLIHLIHSRARTPPRRLGKTGGWLWLGGRGPYPRFLYFFFKSP